MIAIPVKNVSRTPLIVKGGLRVNIFKIIEHTKQGKKTISKIVAFKKTTRMVPDVKIIPAYYVKVIDGNQGS